LNSFLGALTYTGAVSQYPALQKQNIFVEHLLNFSKFTA